MTLSYCFPRGSHPFFPKPNVLQEAEGDRTGDHAPLSDALCLPGKEQAAFSLAALQPEAIIPGTKAAEA